MLIERVTEETIGFKIGPAINAPGRLYDKGALLPFNLLAAETQSAEYLEERINQLIGPATTGARNSCGPDLRRQNCSLRKTAWLAMMSSSFNRQTQLLIPFIRESPALLRDSSQREMRRPVIVLARSREPGRPEGIRPILWRRKPEGAARLRKG